MSVQRRRPWLLDKGEIDFPAFSPDGSRIAFSWKPPNADRFQLALIRAGGGSPLALTSGRASDIGPAWSPDRSRLCFVREGLGENAIYMVALEDGAERRITTLSNAVMVGHQVDWLRDGRTVVMSDNGFDSPLALVDVETRGRRDLPGAPHATDTSPTCSPDGKWIAFSRFFTQTTSDLFVIGVGGGEAKRLTFDGAAKRNQRWTPDGRAILFKARLRNRSGFWRVPFAGGNMEELALPRFATDSFDVQAGPGGTLRIASVDQYEVWSIIKLEIPAEGQVSSQPVRLIASGERGGVNVESNPAISPDGLRVAFVSNRSGSPEIWISDNSGEGARQMTSFGGSEITQPAWSPDGRYLVSAAAPDGRRNLFVVDVATGAMRWLTTGGVEETEPQWSHDGKWITFCSRRSGDQELWRMPATGGAARRLTYNGAAVHRESPDGRWIYFVRHKEPGLRRMPWNGGNEELVLERVHTELYRAWAVGRKGVYYTYKDAAAPRWIVALYDLDSHGERRVAVVQHPLPRWSGTLTISPDERWMLLPTIEEKGSRLVLLSGIRRPA